MKNLDLIYGIAFYSIAHVLVFFQVNGQFLRNSFKKYEFLVAAMGIIISYLYIYATEYTYKASGGLLWPGRFIGFGIGMVIYASGLYIFFNEGLTMKTAVSLILCIALISIQVLWK